MRPGSRFSTSSGVSLDPLDHPHHVAHRLCRSSSGDSVSTMAFPLFPSFLFADPSLLSSPQLPRELQSGPQPLQPLLLRPPDAGPHHVPGKRGSRAASDTSSAYSGSDLMQSSLDDQDMDLTGLVESNVDSDDEEDDTGEVSWTHFPSSLDMNPYFMMLPIRVIMYLVPMMPYCKSLTISSLCCLSHSVSFPHDDCLIKVVVCAAVQGL